MPGGFGELVDHGVLSAQFSLRRLRPDGQLKCFKIIWINILLSGDNAGHCPCLPGPASPTAGIGHHPRRCDSVILRIVFTIGLQLVLELPYLRFVGGSLLLYIAIKLLVQEEASEDSVESSDSLWGAIRTVAIADIVMSLDNVLAIAAAARGHPMLIGFGLLVSIPLIVALAAVSVLHRHSSSGPALRCSARLQVD